MGALAKRRESFIRSLSARHGRKESGYCLCDGPRASGEILKLRPDLIEQVLLREGFECRWKFPVEPDILPAAEFDRIRNTVHSQGILLIVKRPQEIEESDPPQSPFVLLLDRISDPGNFGTMVRTARAAGLKEIWLTEGTVDPYSDKSIRSASGAQFALRIRRLGTLEHTIEKLKHHGFKRVYRTSPAQGSDVFREPALFDRSVIVLGNEGRGVGKIADSIDLNIPMPGDAESLNVAQAATIILFEYVRRNFSC